MESKQVREKYSPIKFMINKYRLKKGDYERICGEYYLMDDNLHKIYIELIKKEYEYKNKNIVLIMPKRKNPDEEIKQMTVEDYKKKQEQEKEKEKEQQPKKKRGRPKKLSN